MGMGHTFNTALNTYLSKEHDYDRSACFLITELLGLRHL